MSVAYKQYSVPEFVRLFPEFCINSPFRNFLPELLNDDRYIVRVSSLGVEFGFKDDNWSIS